MILALRQAEHPIHKRSFRQSCDYSDGSLGLCNVARARAVTGTAAFEAPLAPVPVRTWRMIRSRRRGL